MYGTMEGSYDSQPLLESRRERGRLFNRSPKRNRPVLKTFVSRRRVATPTERRQKSFVYSMFSPRSVEWQAVTFKWFITLVIILDLCAFIFSTDEDLSEQYTERLAAWEAVTSWIFLTEYLLRLIVVTESMKYKNKGPIRGRLEYLGTTPALIDLAATFPYFLERFTGLDLPTLTYLRSFRLLRILKTNGFSQAVSSVWRVFRYNSEILFVGLWIGLAFVLITALLMYYLRPRDQDHAQFKSLPATLFLATMMLTGQVSALFGYLVSLNDSDDLTHPKLLIVTIGRTRWRTALVHLVYYGPDRICQYRNVCDTRFDVDLGFRR